MFVFKTSIIANIDACPPVIDLVGAFGLNRGEWKDDHSMALCLAHILITNNGS